MLQLHGMDEENLGTNVAVPNPPKYQTPFASRTPNKPQMYQIKPVKIPHTDRAPVAGCRAGQKSIQAPRPV